MATNYPTNLDTLTNPTATDKLNSPSHADQHANSNDAIEALQVKVGADSSAVTSSHDYKLSNIADGDKSVSLTGTETLTNKTLTTPIITTPTITTPSITTSINDANGNEVIETPATTSAVNHLKVTNATTGNDVDVAPAGDDTNVGIKVKGKGTGAVKLGDAELEIPDTDGANGQVLQTDGSGILSFADAGSVTSEVTSGATHSLTTDGSTKVIVWAKCTIVRGGQSNNSVDALLQYDGVTKDTVNMEVSPDNEKNTVSFMYTETPPSQTADITIDAPLDATISNPVIMVMKI